MSKEQSTLPSSAHISLFIDREVKEKPEVAVYELIEEILQADSKTLYRLCDFFKYQKRRFGEHQPLEIFTDKGVLTISYQDDKIYQFNPNKGRRRK